MGRILNELATLVGGQVEGDGSLVIEGLAGLEEAQPGQLSFYANTKLVNLDTIRSVWDLLDPKWKGKTIALWPRPNYVSTALLFMYHHPQVGPKFL